MATPEEHEEIVKRLRVMIHGLISTKIIPCSERDIIEGRLPYDKDQLFLSFGINLRVAITSFPLDPVIPLVKIENHYDDIDKPDNFILSSSEKQIPMVLLKHQDFDSEDDFDNDFKNVNIKEDSMDLEFGVDKDNDEDPDYVVDFNDVDVKEDVASESGGEEENIAIAESYYKRHKKCKACNIVFNTYEEYLIHKNEHIFLEVNGLRYKKKVDNGYVSYLPHKVLLQRKEELKNQFVIQIPPPDFTREELNKCVFPKPLQEYIVTNMATKWTQCSTGAKACAACALRIKDFDALIEHYIKCHELKFKCPHIECGMELVGHFYKFAKHVLYHTEPLPQLSVPHQCIACDFSNAFMDKVDKHIKSMGEFHNNKCPRCDQRFFSRSDYLAHVTSKKHEGVVCGWCGKVFDNENKFLPHKAICPKNPTKALLTICTVCGKSIRKESMKVHMVRNHDNEEPVKCTKCGKILRNKESFKIHQRKCTKDESLWANQKVPCPTCGKLVKRCYMKNHDITNHTPEHLKSFVCTECPKPKGFRFKPQYEAHMNIHRNIKPFACKYCGARFSDFSNKRMHERCSHEGHKRK